MNHRLLAFAAAAAWLFGGAVSPVRAEARLSVFHNHLCEIARQEGISLTEACARARSWGITHFDFQHDGSEADVATMKAAGLKPASYVFTSDFGHADETDKVRHAFDFIAEQGFVHLMVVPGFTAEGEDRQALRPAMWPRLKALVEEARARRLSVGIEDFDYDRVLLGSRADLRLAFAEIPELGHVLDTGNYAFWHDDCLAALDEFRARINHVHVKDRARDDTNRSVAAGTGTMPVAEVVRRLLASGYDGCFTLECFGSAHMADDLRTSAAYLRSPACDVDGRFLPAPVIRPEGLRADEREVAVEKTERVTASNGLYRQVETAFVFENPNARQLAGEFEFPLPEGATVCGYRLEVGGEMVPGVICEKQQARVAFENEQRRGVDPGLVEHVRGNVWRTRIFPLPARGRRRAEVTYVVAEEKPAERTVQERCGDYVYEGSVTDAAALPLTAADRLRDFDSGWLLWDASRSRHGASAAADLAALAALPERGDWQLVVFRNDVGAPRRFTVRDELLAALRSEPCDGGTDLAALLAAVPEDGARKLLFSDELDTLGVTEPELERRADFVFVSRPTPALRRVTVTRRRPKPGEKVAAGRLLATAWAADRIADFAGQARMRQAEFLALGREFGVASPVTSYLVLERLEQWLEQDVEPPAELACHEEWVRRRAAQDDAIARKARNAEFERRLLELWQQRVSWWNSPKPERKTPRSGLFDGAVATLAASRSVEQSRMAMAMNAPADLEVLAEGAVSANAVMKRGSAAGLVAAAPKPAAATVTLAAWDPKTPYVETLKAAAKGSEYAAYLGEAEKYGNSPAFYLDAAGWFFRAGMRELGLRIISNLAEFKLGDVRLWRTMGWRLREAGALDEAVRAFRQALALRGEEGQSYRDLALVLAERGKAAFARGEVAAAAADLNEALARFHETAFVDHARRAARRSNDLQVSVVALEELNALISWCERASWPGDLAPRAPEMDAAYRRDLPLDLRIVLAWDADETDVDLHVLEPNGEEAYYGNRRTAKGGFVGEDVTTGYGPEEYLGKEAQKGTYRILANYFASHQQSLTGAATVSASVYTNWARPEERHQVLTLRLDRPRDKAAVGEVKID